MRKRHIASAVLSGVAVVAALGWLARARLAGEIARNYFSQHGVASSLGISALDGGGLSGRFALGPADAPDLAADHIELVFDPLSFIPRVTEVRLIHPVVRARIDASGKVTLGSLQAWIDSLQSGEGHSRYVSDDLKVSLRGLELHAATPAGDAVIDGDVELVKNLPVRATLTLKPAHLSYKDLRADLTTAQLAYDEPKKTLSAHISGTFQTPSAQAQALDASLEASDFFWHGPPFTVSAVTAHLHATAAALTAGTTMTAPTIDITAHTLSADSKGNEAADLTVTADAGLSVALGGLGDPAITAAVARNLKHLSLAFSGHGERKDGAMHFALAAPALVTGADKATLKIPGLTINYADGLTLDGAASLSGPGLPALTLALRNASWKDGNAKANISMTARLDFASLRGIDLATSGALALQGGHYAFTPQGCAHLALAAFQSGASDLATHVKTDLCATGTLLSGDAAGWKLTGKAQGASADLPLFNAHADAISADLNFQGQGAPQAGSATITTAAVSDLTATPRFKPVTISGAANLAADAWTGRIAVTSPKQDALATVSFRHELATGAGTAHIDAPTLSFAPNKFQPTDILPVLAPLRQANGTAAFSGDLQWTKDALTSSGKLSMGSLDFLTPFGAAHGIKTDLALSSLLPPSAAPGQHIAIARIDWTLPLSAVSLDVGFTTASASIANATAGIAQGHASLDPLTINLADPGRLSGTVHLDHVALDDLIAASNLGDKLKLVGKISGTVPFTLSPEGLHIANGHVTADGPGRLEVNRALWTQGGTVAANAVQDFAYQALEHLAYDQLTADLNSIAGGRLQIVFHVKGHSDPPQLQKAEVAITDLIAGTALQKAIPLPSNTPIDLTLDTSLNFDELLKSYSEAWSKSLSSGTGAPQ